MTKNVLSDDAFVALLAAAEAERQGALKQSQETAQAHQGARLAGQNGQQVLSAILSQRGWAMREGQMEMVRYIDEAFDHEEGRRKVGVVGINAPVGTGKTLGYFAPALARGGRIVIATSTKALQDQIVGEELPQLAKDILGAYGRIITFTVLKGKSNYPCWSHLDSQIAAFEAQEAMVAAFDTASPTSQPAELDLDDDGHLVGRGDEDELDMLRQIRQSTRLAFARGDVSRLDADLLLSRLRPALRKSVDAKHSCPSRRFDLEDASIRDFIDDDEDVWRSAYARAMTADVVVMNTALLVEEVRKQSNKQVGSLAPSILEGASTVIIDEAHHAPDIVTGAFSARISKSKALKLAAAVDKAAPDGTANLEALTVDLFREIDIADDLPFASQLNERIGQLCEAYVASTRKTLETVTAHARDQNMDKKKSKVLMSAIDEARDDLIGVVAEAGGLAQRKTDRQDKQVHTSRVSITNVGDAGDDDFELSVVPVDVSFFRDRLVSALFAQSIEEQPANAPEDKLVVLCSGTMSLTVPKLLGLGGGSVMRQVESPFDPNRARLCIPKDLCSPNESKERWIRDGWAYAAKAITATGGRTLFLCTSRAMVDEFAAKARASLGYTVLAQGEAPRADLIAKFTSDQTSVLFATMGYWEGIDVPGPALSLVVIDKAPFLVPGNAIAAARKQWVEAEGGNAFSVVEVSHISTMLAQGAGRLIRAEADTGGVLILDSRLATKSYASAALAQMDGRWLMYHSLDPFVRWMRAVREGAETNNPDVVLGHPVDGARPLRPSHRVVRR